VLRDGARHLHNGRLLKRIRPNEGAGTCPVIATRGTESSIASASPVTRFVAPGPEVAMHTPTSPEVLAHPSAANTSPCSCRQRTFRMVRGPRQRLMDLHGSPRVGEHRFHPSRSSASTRMSHPLRASPSGKRRHEVRGRQGPPGSAPSSLPPLPPPARESASAASSPPPADPPSPGNSKQAHQTGPRQQMHQRQREGRGPRQAGRQWH